MAASDTITMRLTLTGVQESGGELAWFGRTASKGLDDTARSAQRAAAAVDQTAESGGRASKNLSFAFQNVGYQLQDAIVQIQGGTSAFKVLAQQGSQMASAFGPVGTLVGLVVAGIGALGGAVLTTARNTATLVDVQKSLKEALEAAPAAAKDWLEQLQKTDSTVISLTKHIAELSAGSNLARGQNIVTGLGGATGPLANLFSASGQISPAGRSPTQVELDAQRQAGEVTATLDAYLQQAVAGDRAVQGIARAYIDKLLAELASVQKEVTARFPGNTDVAVDTAAEVNKLSGELTGYLKVLGQLGSDSDAAAGKTKELQKALADVGGGAKPSGKVGNPFADLTASMGLALDKAKALNAALAEGTGTIAVQAHYDVLADVQGKNITLTQDQISTLEALRREQLYVAASTAELARTLAHPGEASANARGAYARANFGGRTAPAPSPADATVDDTAKAYQRALQSVGNAVASEFQHAIQGFLEDLQSGAKQGFEGILEDLGTTATKLGNTVVTGIVNAPVQAEIQKLIDQQKLTISSLTDALSNPFVAGSLGIAAGTTVSGLTGGNPTGSSIGALLGAGGGAGLGYLLAGAGTLIAPGIGTAIGAGVGGLAGGIFGGLIGGGSGGNNRAGARLDLGSGEVILGSDSKSGANQSAVNSLTQQIASLRSLLFGQGGRFDDSTLRLRLGDQTGGQLTVNGITQSFGDATQLTLAAMKELVKEASNLPEIVRQVAEASPATTADQYLKDVQFAQTFQDLTAPVGDFVKQLQALEAQFDDAAAQAERLGLSEADLSTARDKAIADLQKSALDQVLAQRDQIKAYFQGLYGPVQQAQTSINLSSISALSPQEQLALARQQFETTASAAQAGDQTAIQSLPQVAQALVEQARSFDAQGSLFQSIFQEVNQTLQGVIDQGATQQEQLIDIIPTELRSQTRDFVGALRDQTQQLLDAFTKLQRQLASTTARAA